MTQTDRRILATVKWNVGFIQTTQLDTNLPYTKINRNTLDKLITTRRTQHANIWEVLLPHIKIQSEREQCWSTHLSHYTTIANRQQTGIPLGIGCKKKVRQYNTLVPIVHTTVHPSAVQTHVTNKTRNRMQHAKMWKVFLLNLRAAVEHHSHINYIHNFRPLLIISNLHQSIHQRYDLPTRASIVSFFLYIPLWICTALLGMHSVYSLCTKKQYPMQIQVLQF